MPHPISTPTAEGITADSVGITEPMVAPYPRWASAISAIGSVRIGRSAVCSACFLVFSSRIDAHDLTPTPPPNSSIIRTLPSVARTRAVIALSVNEEPLGAEAADTHGLNGSPANLLVGGRYLCRWEGIERKDAGKNDLTLVEDARTSGAGRSGGDAVP